MEAFYAKTVVLKDTIKDTRRVLWIRSTYFVGQNWISFLGYASTLYILYSLISIYAAVYVC
jgi:hypothetical protein